LRKGHGVEAEDLRITERKKGGDTRAQHSLDSTLIQPTENVPYFCTKEDSTKRRKEISQHGLRGVMLHSFFLEGFP